MYGAPSQSAEKCPQVFPSPPPPMPVRKSEEGHLEKTSAKGLQSGGLRCRGLGQEWLICTKGKLAIHGRGLSP